MVKRVLGYELRCAPPCALDIEYTRGLGGEAVEFMLNGGTNAIITLQQGQVIQIRFLDMITQDTGRTAGARSIGILTVTDLPINS
jgi:ATP-dependent phosphofructokinase / diphosphate-dependent phosphofructokinase